MFENDWGKPWTYLVVSIVWMAIAAFVWAMVEQRRDSDSATFYGAARENYEQMEALRSYAWADSTNCLDRTAVKAILRSITIVRTRAEVDSLQKVKDSIANDTLPKLTWQLESGNFYPHSNVAKNGGALLTTGFDPVNNGLITITGKATLGSTAIEIDGRGENSGAKTTFNVSQEEKYIVDLNAGANKPNAFVEVYADNLLVSQFVPVLEYKNFKTPEISGASSITIKYYYSGTSKDGDEIYTDDIKVSKYVLK